MLSKNEICSICDTSALIVLSHNDRGVNALIIQKEQLNNVKKN